MYLPNDVGYNVSIIPQNVLILTDKRSLEVIQENVKVKFL